MTRLVDEVAERSSVAGQGFELVPQRRVAFVRDEDHAFELLGGAHADEDARELARALASGELVLVYRDDETPLDPPDPNAVPLLSDLSPDGGDPIAHEPEHVTQTWYEVVLVDGYDVPLPGVDLRLSCNGDTRQLMTDADGRVRVDDATGHVAMVSVPATKQLEQALHAAAKRPVTDERLVAGETRDVAVFGSSTVGPVRIDAEAPHTISIQRATPAVHILELAAVSFFEDREVLLPDAEALPSAEPGPDRVPAINVVAKAVEFLAAHPGKHVLVVGHTDTVGKQGDNVELSKRRAENVQLYLAGEIDAWAAHCQEHREVEDVQRILRWIAASFAGFDCDPGAIDDDMGPQTRGAIQAFRDAYAGAFGETIGGGDDVGTADWKGYARMYDEAVAIELGDAAMLASVRETVTFTDPAAVGFGERHPTENPGCDDLDSERNRRVEIVFFDESELELFADESSVELALYGEGALVERHWLAAGFGALADELAVRVVYEDDGGPVCGQTCTLTLPSGEVRQATVDGEGFARFSGLPRSTCEFRLPEIEAFDWDADDDGPRDLPEPPMEDEEVELEPDDDYELTPAQRSVLDDDEDEDEAA